MEWLAEFMELEVNPNGADLDYIEDGRYVLTIDYPLRNWHFWMEEVEPKIREKELWIEYIAYRLRMNTDEDGIIHIEDAMQDDLPKRAEALRRVLEANDEVVS